MDVQEEMKKTAVRMERLENHYEFLKNSNQRIEANVTKISDALLGTEFGDIGLVERFKENSKKTNELEREIEKMKIYLKQASWLFGVIAGAIIVILVKYIFKGI